MLGKAAVSRLERAWDHKARGQHFEEDQALRQVGGGCSGALCGG